MIHVINFTIWMGWRRSSYRSGAITAHPSEMLKQLSNRADLLSTWRLLLAAVGKPSMRHALTYHGTAPGNTPRTDPWVVSSRTILPDCRLPQPVELYS